MLPFGIARLTARRLISEDLTSSLAKVAPSNSETSLIYFRTQQGAGAPSSPEAKALVGPARNEDAAQATSFVITSASEAIQLLDCFVAVAPRKTGVAEKKMAGSRPAREYRGLTSKEDAQESSCWRCTSCTSTPEPGGGIAIHS
jgi:hypothetical protein